MLNELLMFLLGIILGAIVALYFFSVFSWFPNKVNENMARIVNGEHQYAEYCYDPSYKEDKDSYKESK